MQSFQSRRDGTAPTVKSARNMQNKQAQLDKLVTWLVDHGVGKRNARRFLIKCVRDLPAAALHTPPDRPAHQRVRQSHPQMP